MYVIRAYTYMRLSALPLIYAELYHIIVFVFFLVAMIKHNYLQAIPGKPINKIPPSKVKEELKKKPSVQEPAQSGR